MFIFSENVDFHYKTIKAMALKVIMDIEKKYKINFNIIIDWEKLLKSIFLKNRKYRCYILS